MNFFEHFAYSNKLVTKGYINKNGSSLHLCHFSHCMKPGSFKNHVRTVYSKSSKYPNSNRQT